MRRTRAAAAAAGIDLKKRCGQCKTCMNMMAVRGGNCKTCMNMVAVRGGTARPA
jgi:hypothetical protein